ncbi:DinB family protein [Paenibacillus spongiae]|uniref:DinB family protein n=1 Tax=Paenibacillus spongiae TaxID=2909671 RepID=A0ABY5SA50_9BACL|nr:DinB family protein [Paenibacillus spongiae]UVI29415.1 DinB family protein [Paenibacillus spongiae]
MKRIPETKEYPPYFETYVRLVPEGDIMQILKSQFEATVSFLSALSEQQGSYRYAEGKWSIKEVIGHVTDNERVWNYRLLRIARNNAKEFSGYEEDVFAAHATFDDWPIAEVIQDYSAVRQSTLTLLQGLPESAWIREGVLYHHPLTARAAAYVIAGHELHHVNVIKDRYQAAFSSENNGDKES